MHPVRPFSDYLNLSSDLEAIEEFKTLKNVGYQALIVIVSTLAGVFLIYPGIVAFRGLTHTFWEIEERENTRTAQTSKKAEGVRQELGLGEKTVDQVDAKGETNQTRVTEQNGNQDTKATTTTSPQPSGTQQSSQNTTTTTTTTTTQSSHNEKPTEHKTTTTTTTTTTQPSNEKKAPTTTTATSTEKPTATSSTFTPQTLDLKIAVPHSMKKLSEMFSLDEVAGYFGFTSIRELLSDPVMKPGLQHSVPASSLSREAGKEKEKTISFRFGTEKYFVPTNQLMKHEYFKTMFRTEMRESKEKTFDLSGSTLTQEGFKKYCIYLSTGKIDIDGDCFFELLQIAEGQQLQELVDLCLIYFVNYIDFFDEDTIDTTLATISSLNLEPSLVSLSLEACFNNLAISTKKIPEDDKDYPDLIKDILAKKDTNQLSLKDILTFRDWKIARDVLVFKNHVNNTAKPFATLNFGTRTLRQMGRDKENLKEVLKDAKDFPHWLKEETPEPRIHTLDLSYSNFSLLPPEIGEFKRITTLNLLNNDFLALPQELEQLLNLETIYIEKEKVKMLPEKVREFVGLEIFYNPPKSPPVADLPLDAYFQPWERTTGFFAMFGDNGRPSTHPLLDYFNQTIPESPFHTEKEKSYPLETAIEADGKPLNANKITIPNCHSCIAGEFPKTPSGDHELFWKAAMEHNALLVDLSPVEILSQKWAAPYYPTELNTSKVYGEITVTLDNKENLRKGVMLCQYSVKWGDTTKTISRMEFDRWRDFNYLETADITMLHPLLDCVDTWIKDHPDTSPMVYSASFQHERNELFIALLSLKSLIENKHFEKDQSLEMVIEVIKQGRQQYHPFLEEPRQMNKLINYCKEKFAMKNDLASTIVN